MSPGGGLALAAEIRFQLIVAAHPQPDLTTQEFLEGIRAKGSACYDSYIEAPSKEGPRSFDMSARKGHASRKGWRCDSSRSRAMTPRGSARTSRAFAPRKRVPPADTLAAGTQFSDAASSPSADSPSWWVVTGFGGADGGATRPGVGIDAAQLEFEPDSASGTCSPGGHPSPGSHRRLRSLTLNRACCRSRATELTRECALLASQVVWPCGSTSRSHADTSGQAPESIAKLWGSS